METPCLKLLFPYLRTIFMFSPKSHQFKRIRLNAVQQSAALCVAVAAYASKRLPLFRLQVWIEDEHQDVVHQVVADTVRLCFYFLQHARVSTQKLKENDHGLYGPTNVKASLCTEV